MLYVARRPFRQRGVFYDTGVVIDDPDVIPHLRSRLASRDVLEFDPKVTRDLPNWVAYLESRQSEPLDRRIYLAAGLQPPIEEAEEVKEPEVKAPEKAPAKAAKVVAPEKPKVFGKKPE